MLVVLLHHRLILIVMIISKVSLLRDCLFLFDRLQLLRISILFQVHDVYIVIELTFFARFGGWPSAAAVADSLNTTHFACN